MAEMDDGDNDDDDDDDGVKRAGPDDILFFLSRQAGEKETADGYSGPEGWVVLLPSCRAE
jgi:hypothetical protein